MVLMEVALVIDSLQPSGQVALFCFGCPLHGSDLLELSPARCRSGLLTPGCCLLSLVTCLQKLLGRALDWFVAKMAGHRSCCSLAELRQLRAMGLSQVAQGLTAIGLEERIVSVLLQSLKQLPRSASFTNKWPAVSLAKAPQGFAAQVHDHAVRIVQLHCSENLGNHTGAAERPSILNASEAALRHNSKRES